LWLLKAEQGIIQFYFKQDTSASTKITKIFGNFSFFLIRCSDVARPLSYKTKTKTAFFKDYQIIHSRPLA